MTQRFQRQNGYSLIEIIIYSSLMAMIVAVISYVINMLFIANAAVKATRRVENSSIIAMDKIIREIRSASAVDLSGSDLSSVTNHNTDDGVLSLIIPESGGTTKTERFYLSGGRIMFDENNNQIGPLSLSDVRVTSLQFWYLSATSSKAVKVEFVVAGPTSTPSVNERFYGTAVLRGSYQ